MAKKKYTPEATIDLLYNQLMSDYKGDAQAEAERQRQKSAEKKASGNSTNSSTSAQNTLQSPSAVSRGASAVGNIYKAPKRKYTTGGTVHGNTKGRSFAKDQTTKPKTSGTRGIGSATQEAFERGLSSRSLKENAGQRSSLSNKKSYVKESDLSDISRNRSHNQAKILDKKQAYVQAQRYENELKKQRAEYDRLREEHPTSEWLKEEGWGALTGFNSTLASTADWLLPDVITPKAVQNALDYYKKEDEKQQKKVEEVRGGDPLRTIGGNLGVNIVQNVPAMLYAPLTAEGTIATTAGTLLNPETLSQTGNAITRALYSVARETGNNPMFWETFLRTAGPTYDKEIESGADPVRATLSALTNGLLNAQIEIGGGIEKFDPTETFWKALRRSGEEEGLEEIQQYAVEGLTNKALGSNTAKWFSTKRGEDAVINPIDMAEQGAYGALAGGLMGGGRAGVATLSRSLADAEYNRAFPDSKAHTQDLVEQALMQAREGQKSSEAEILASNIQNMMEQGEEVPTVLVRQLHNEVLRAQAENERDFSERKTEGYQQAVSEGRANTVETQDTEEESRVFRSVADEKAQTYYDTAMDKMGENASERSARAISKLMVGVHTNQDIDTILIDKNARNAVEEMTGINLPIKNTEAREILETRGLTNMVANRDNMLQETHNVIRSNMRSREGAVFEKNYDNAVKTIGVANAPEIYESVFSRFKNAGMVRGSDFDSAYDRIVSPLTKDFGEELGGRIALVFNRDFAHQAFDAGRQAYIADEAKTSAREKAVSAENAGTVTYKHDTESRLSTRQKSFMTKFAERAKVGIEFYDGTQEGEDDSANGYYENGVIHININSTNKLVTVAKHELTHHIKVTAPEMYRKLEDFVIKKWYNNDPDAFDERVLEYQRKWNCSVEEAYEEIIANASEAFFTDRGTIDDAIKFSKKLGHTIHDGIRTLLDTFLDIQDTDRLGDRGYGEFLKELNILKDAQRMWLEALNESVERGKNNTAEATEADTEVRRSLKDIGMTLKDGNARWTDERIDYLIDEFGASNPDYSRAYAVLMNPRDFLKLTLSDEELNNWNERSAKVDPIYGDQRWLFRKLDTEELKNEKQTPFLEIYSKDGTMVQGHEGRHRMRALLEAGVKSVPVVIRDTDTKYTKKPLGSMTLSSQDFGYDPVNNGAEITIKDLVPVKESNRAELVEKFGGEAEVRFSKKDDKTYMDAVNRGDMETAQEMVDEEAKKHGLTSRLMHGTNSFGFTTVEYGKGDDHISFFATDSEEVASSYVRPMLDDDEPNTYVRSIGKPIKNRVNEHSPIGDIIDALNKVRPSSYKVATEEIIKNETDEQFRYVLEDAKELDRYTLPDKVQDVIEKVANSKDPQEAISLMDSIKDVHDIYYNDMLFYQATAKLSSLKSSVDLLKRELQWTPDNVGYWEINGHKNFVSSEDVYEEYLDETGLSGRGIYELYASTNNPLTVYCNGSTWNNIKTTGEMADDLGQTATTRQIAKWAYDHGYGTVIFDDVRDTGKYGSPFTNPSTVYAFLEGGDNVIKSADPVTYDDNGNVIPLSERFNDKNENIRYSHKDSDGRTLTEAQVDYFKDSKARDKDGNLLVMYHGSPNRFTIFDIGKARPGYYGRGFYFTDSRSRATQYGNPYTVYLDVKNPLTVGSKEITRSQLKKYIQAIADNEDYGLENYGYGATVDSVLKDVWGRDDFSMLQDLNATAVGDFAEAVKLFNDVNGTDYDGIVTDTETVVFRPEQIKETENKNPSKDADIRFSKKADVEETQTMIAWHNINSGNINGVLELGGLAMPSFALRPSNMGFSGYGDISIIADKRSIDPKAGKSQMIFGGDAWTPMFPPVDIKIDSKVAENLRKRFYGILGFKSSDELRKAFAGLELPALDVDNLADQIQRWGDPYSAYGRNDALRLAYVMNGMGVQMVIPMKQGDLRGYDKKFWELVDERIPEDVDLYDGNSMQYEPALREAMYEAYGREFDERLANLGKLHLPNPYKEELSFAEVDNILYALRAYRENGIPDVVDIQALEKALGEKINEEDYRLWIDDLFEGIVEKRGIRNDKDLFTPSGSRRGFDALHYEYNLENIVKAMKSQSKQGNTSWLANGSNVKGASLKSYNDIEYVRNDLGRIVSEKTEEVKALYDQFDEQVKTLANKVAKGDPFTGSEILADVLSHAKTEASIFSYLNREYSYLRTQDHLELKPLATDIYEIGQLANTLPMEYFEAKVYREFPLQEALAIVVPDTLDSKIVSRIKEHNVNVLTYEAGNDEDRLAKVNSIEGARFSKKETDGNAKTIEYQSTIRKLEKNVEGLKAQFKRTNKKPNPVEARRQAGRLIKRHASNMRIHEDVANTLTEIYEMYAKRGAKAFDDIYAIAERTAVEIVNNISEVHFEGQEEYNQIKDYLRDTDIVVSEEMKRNITDFNDFRKSHFGKLKLVNGERSNIDSVYAELSEMFPSQFTDEYVNPADQLNHIADVLDSYAPFYETLDGTSEEMQDYVVAIASDLMETAYNLQKSKTFADKKYDEKVKAVKKVREEALANKREALSKMRKRYERREAKEKQERQEKREARRERKQESEARTRLLEVARRLSKIKSTEEFERLRDKLIGDLDLEAKSMTGKTRMKLEDLERWYMDQVENNDWFVRNEALEKKFERLRKTHISEMSLEDVQNLTDILLMLEHKIRNDKKLINSQYKKDVFTASYETSEGIKQSKGLKFKGLHKLDNVFVGQTLSPIRYMRRITGYDENNPLMIATRELENGQNKMLDYRMRALKSFERFSSLKFTSHLNGARAEEITVDATTMDMKPTTVKIIPAERIWFYLSSKNADNMRHIVNGGVRIPDAKLLKKGKRTEAYDEGTLVRFSKSQVQEIIDGMAAEEKAYADAVYNYFNNVAPEATNAVSEMLDGISIAKVRNYFPIHVDDSFLDVEAETIKRDGTLEGMGSHKERVQSSKPAYAEDVSDMLIKAIEADAKYVGLAIPIRNFSKIYGSSSLESARGEAQHLELAGQVENGLTAQGYNVPAGQEYGGEESASYRTRTGGYISVKDAIRKNWTSDALGYIDDFLGDLQFPQSKVGTVEKTLRSLTSNYAGAVLTLNASVALKQTASFPTAGAVLGWKPLIKSFGKMGKLDLEYADSVTPLLSYRAEGFNFREAGDIQNRAGRDNWFKRIMRMPAFNWIQEMDLLTTRKLFKASEIYVKDNFPNLAYRGEAYNEKVAEVFNKVITETQPNYTVMERPGHLRSDSTLERTLSMFKTQPYQNFNIVYDATGNYLAKRQAFKDSKTEANRQELKEASKSLGRAVTSQIAQLATFAVMTSLWALARGKDDRWRDEEGNLSFASYLKRLAHDMASGVASEFFLGSDIFTAIDSLISDSYYYGFSSVTDSSINDFFNTGIDMTKLLQQAWDYALSDDKESIDTYKIHKQLEKVVTEGGRFTGIPTGNLINLTNLIYRWACIAQDGKYVGEYEAMKMSFSADKYKKALLLEAYKNDKVAYKKIRQMMIEDGFKETTLDNYIKKNA